MGSSDTIRSVPSCKPVVLVTVVAGVNVTVFPLGIASTCVAKNAPVKGRENVTSVPSRGRVVCVMLPEYPRSEEDSPFGKRPNTISFPNRDESASSPTANGHKQGNILLSYSGKIKNAVILAFIIFPCRAK